MVSRLRSIARVTAVVCLIAGLVSLYIFVNRLLLPYNESGNYFDAATGITYHSQAVVSYGSLATLGFLLFLFLLKLAAPPKPKG